MTNEKPIYNLKVRIVEFSKEIIRFVKLLKKDSTSTVIISQCIPSSTSIGANYQEADNAESRRDFIHKIGICRKEAEETVYWLELLREVFPADIEKINFLQQESKELSLIFVSIIKKTKANITQASISH